MLVSYSLQVVYILADALPGFSNFYINYILLSCFLQVAQNQPFYKGHNGRP